MRFYIGYDSKQPLISKVCQSSMLKWIDSDQIALLKLNELTDCYHRTQDPNQATEFSFTRFLVPYLNNYKGWAVFCDGDFLWVDDPSSLLDYCDPDLAVLCVQHDIKQEQLTTKKMYDKIQLWYPRKNWSSLMLINCEHPLTRRLTPKLVSEAKASYLHQLEWAKDSIGQLPLQYNFLVGYYPHQDNVCAYHFTDGTPIHPGYENCQYNELWKNQLALTT